MMPGLQLHSIRLWPLLRRPCSVVEGLWILIGQGLHPAAPHCLSLKCTLYPWLVLQQCVCIFLSQPQQSFICACSPSHCLLTSHVLTLFQCDILLLSQGWRMYINAASSKRGAGGTGADPANTRQQPLPLAEVMPTMMCPCPAHDQPKLEFPPPSVAKK